MEPTCRLLAIDGGGIRGILPARVLAEIERRTSQPIAKTFNLLAGTSTGGLLALGLAIPKPGKSRPYSAEDMLGLYRTKGPKIFASSLWHSVASLGAITATRYESDNIEDVLEDLLKDRLLSDCLDEIDVLIPAYEIERREAYFFKSWHAKGEPEDHRNTPAQRDFLSRDVARATSAAPTYFEPAHVKNRASQTFSFSPAPKRAMNWDQLLPPVARAVHGVLMRLEGAVSGPSGLVQCFLVHGSRGSGKTTVLLSAQEAVRNNLFFDPGSNGEPARWKNEAFENDLRKQTKEYANELKPDSLA